EMERVMASTTLPTVLLGGDPAGTQDEIFASWQAALTLPGVQGLTVGRTLLYPADGDVAGAVSMAASLLNTTGPAVRVSDERTLTDRIPVKVSE
ncbi:deoxyribose-phosphate aldolase, partial [Paenarthrobacter sp. CM16]|nr:deoxyribose-phosphate aldolase [Paenarthrobacter sp. CM16]